MRNDRQLFYMKKGEELIKYTKIRHHCKIKLKFSQIV